jgi:hypothetical protein
VPSLGLTPLLTRARSLLARLGLLLPRSRRSFLRLGAHTIGLGVVNLGLAPDLARLLPAAVETLMPGTRA